MSKKRKIAYFAAVLAVLALVSLVAADALLSRESTADFIAMSTTVSLDITGFNSQQAADLIKKRTLELDTGLLSKTAVGSEIFSVNQSGHGTVSDELAGWLDALKKFEQTSSGSFCADLGEIVSLWDIGGENERVPSVDEIAAALAHTGKWSIDGSTVTLENGASLDLGAVGKGIACDEARKILAERKCSEAIVAVGGSVLLFSSKEKSFKIGIRDPLGDASDYAAILETGSCCVSTSGSYERFFTDESGKKYHHIFDPSTGFPSDSGLLSVTVVSQSGLLSDALSTACFVLGYEKSLPLLEKYSAQAVFITENKEFLSTDGIASALTVTAGGYTRGEK